MGREWMFNFNLEKKDTFDLKAYQALLPQLKAEFKPKFEKSRYDFQVCWCPDDPLPPADNVYARFTYKCTRHDWGPDHPVWHLFWDPTIVSEELSRSNIHGRCGPSVGYGATLQERVVKEFPTHFYYDNDCKDDYCREMQYSRFQDDDSDEVLDFTACDKDDCGYCGKCPY